MCRVANIFYTELNDFLRYIIFFDILALAISVLYCYINTTTVKKKDSVSITKLQSELFFLCLVRINNSLSLKSTCIMPHVFLKINLKGNQSGLGILKSFCLGICIPFFPVELHPLIVFHSYRQKEKRLFIISFEKLVKLDILNSTLYGLIWLAE